MVANEKMSSGGATLKGMGRAQPAHALDASRCGAGWQIPSRALQRASMARSGEVVVARERSNGFGLVSLEPLFSRHRVPICEAPYASLPTPQALIRALIAGAHCDPTSFWRSESERGPFQVRLGPN